MRINLTQKELYIDNFELLFSEKFNETKKQMEVEFFFEDKFDFCPAISASLFYSWVMYLKTIKKNKIVKISYYYEDFSNQVKKMFFGNGLFQSLNENGVIIRLKNYVITPPAYKLAIVKNKHDLDIILEDLETGNRDSIIVNNLLKDISQFLIREIIENSLTHNQDKSFPYIFFNSAIAGDANSKNPTFLTHYGRGQKYLEICLGDLGNGIINTIKKTFPRNWHPPSINSKKLTIDERALLYAFEYASTGNSEKRQERIDKLLNSENDVDHKDIASGLFTVLDITKRYNGQFILRTSNKIISFDFFNNVNDYIIRGITGSDLKLHGLSKFPGTHYEFRIPLRSFYDKQETRIFDGEINDSFNIEILPMDEIELKCESQIINNIVEKVYNQIGISSIGKRLLIIDLSYLALSSKGEQIITHVLSNIKTGNVKLLINTNHSSLLSESSKLASKDLNLMIGSIIHNRFIDWNSTDTTKTISQSMLKKIVNKLVSEYKMLLHKRLISDEINLSNGPFLIPGKYYTKNYFYTDKFLRDQRYGNLAVDWFLSFLDVKIRVVLVESDVLRILSNKIKNKYKEIFREELTFLYATKSTLSESFDFYGRKGILFTDVICSGETLTNYLKYNLSIDISKVVTLVDARQENELGTSLKVEDEGQLKFYYVHSILKQYLPTYSDFPSHSKENDRLYVIDKEKQRPILKVRPKKAKINVEETILKAANAGALLNGHYQFRKKHFNYFIHFPRYFSSIRSELEDWLDDQINHILHKYEGMIENVVFLIFKDSSLEWLTLFLKRKEFNVSFEIESVEYKDIVDPYTSNKDYIKSTFILILPAIASGDTQQKFIEYSAGYKPNSIELLSFVSRMNPELEMLYSGISKYHSSFFEFSYYMNFPITSFSDLRNDCPYCKLINKIKSLELNGFKHLIELIEKKKNLMSPISLDNYHLGYNNDLNIENSSIKNKAYLRALYELSDTPEGNRKKLNNMIIENDDLALVFLEIISEEFFTYDFSKEILTEKLYKSYEKLVLLSRKIFDNKQINISKYLFAIEYFNPYFIAESLPKILSKNSKSLGEIEECIFVMLTLERFPQNISQLEEAISITDKKSSIVNDFYEFCSKNAKTSNNFQEALLEIQNLWAEIERSSFTFENIRNLNDLTNLEFSTITTTISEVWKFWKEKTSNIKSKVKNSVPWKTINKDQQIEVKLNELTKRIVELVESINGKFQDEFSEYEIKNINSIINAIVEFRGRFSKMIYDKYVINAHHCSLATTTNEYVTSEDGSKLFLRKSFNPKELTYVFFTMNELEYVLDELLKNCIENKHSTSKGSYVHLRIYNEDKFIVIEIEDDIEGKYKFDGLGGLHQINERCERFGASISHLYFEESKKISIHLHKWPRIWDSRGNK